MMNALANLLWDPFLCLLYLVVGLLFVAATRGIALRQALAVFGRVWRSEGGARAEPTQGLPHREAFLSALAASVGVGNLAGVATALHLGGPGALFWMWISALLGMSFRLTSAFLAGNHRNECSRRARATPMAYLETVLPDAGPRLPRAVALLLIGLGLINANLIQANSIAHALTHDLGLSALSVALPLTALLALVTLGGLNTLVVIAARLVPSMLVLYLIVGLYSLFSDPAGTLRSLELVFTYAFSPYPFASGVGGFVVMRSLQYGVSRGIFSHGSGIGMAPFFQAYNEDHPGRGAFMAAMVPLVDTLLVCTVTGLVILKHGFWQFLTSAYLTVSAFEAGAGLPGRVVVVCCLVLFAFTTMISWAHFGERCAQYLGLRRPFAFRLLFCGVCFCGPFVPVALVWSLGDVLIGLLLLLHLLPLSVALLRQRPRLLAALEELAAEA
ncbi:MAG: amino acid carrier protein [Myxococcales bacterium]|nr:amino acid carrier protein [Myxococcales bacterium]